MAAESQQLKSFSNPEFKRGASSIKQGLWYVVNAVFFKSAFFPFYGLKRILLRVFGAKLGKGVLVKPNVNIKYPWKLSMGNHIWIGEEVWIDNLDQVTIGDNVCISQGAMLLCGNHNYKKSTFDLFTQPIQILDGVWICSKATVGPGVTCNPDCILAPHSFANSDLEKGMIYAGVPAIKKGERF
jgi:putative colanic acid biosynthesis acetyltransferase WcaF